MSRSPSPASSLDYFQSDGSASEEEYRPSSSRRAPPKRRGPPLATSAGASGSSGKKGTTLKINLSALARARDTAAAHPADGPIEEEEEGVEEEEDFETLTGGRIVDMSNRELKKDHTARPLWVDESGHMYVLVSCFFAYPDYSSLIPRLKDQGGKGPGWEEEAARTWVSKLSPRRIKG